MMKLAGGVTVLQPLQFRLAAFGPFSPMAAISPVVLTERSVFELTHEGRRVLTKNSGHLSVKASLTLELEKSFECDADTEAVRVSPDHTHIACLVKRDDVASSLDVIDFDSGLRSARFPLPKRFAIRDIQWSPDSKCLLYFSELGIFFGVFSLTDSLALVMEGPTPDDFGDPICAFSPDGDCFTAVLGNRARTYLPSDGWTLVEEARCDMDCAGIVWVDSASFATWSSDSLTVSTPSDRRLHRERLGSAIRAGAVSPSGRLFAMATLDSKVYIYDTISWKRLLVLEHSQSVGVDDTAVSVESETVGHRSERFFKLDFARAVGGPVVFKEAKTRYDTLQTRLRNRYRLQFAAEDSVLASYDPGIPSAVWIWDVSSTRPLIAVIVLRETTSPVLDLRWHPSAERLAVVLEDRAVFWSRTRGAGGTAVFAVHRGADHGEPVRFSGWCCTKASIAALTAHDRGVFVYLPPDEIGADEGFS